MVRRLRPACGGKARMHQNDPEDIDYVCFVVLVWISCSLLRKIATAKSISKLDQTRNATGRKNEVPVNKIIGRHHQNKHSAYHDVVATMLETYHAPNDIICNMQNTPIYWF